MPEPVIDAHFHVDDVPALGWHMPASLALEQLDAAGVQTAVIMTITDAPEVNPTALEMIADVCAAHPGRFFPRHLPDLLPRMLAGERVDEPDDDWDLPE